MEKQLKVLEKRHNHEELRQLIPEIDNYQIKSIYEQKDGFVEWLVFKKEDKRFGIFIEHREDFMVVSTN